ncbi:hypothetical protein M3223_02000 [Paenibacillus pasadenensis]|uniref:hypothetical protein n=1 Tax=Paenibacillus pasadenensis TaxID=217090 RepID=UPI00204005B4|nr:hypothetical protein [Paenibacillus pasadenensis]MCM3746121.1 hypothetical protein [Paenibacillus pasadenensis]
MRNKKRYIAFMMILALSLCAVFVSNAEKNTPFYFSKHFVISEKGLSEDGIEQGGTYEVWFNDKGHYRYEVTSGKFAGDFEVWDGKKLYQYTQIIGDMTIRDLSGSEQKGAVIPHAYFGDSYEKALDKQRRGKLIKQEKRDAKGTRQEFKQEQENGKISYSFTEDGIPLESSLESNGRSLHQLKLELVENISSFDDSKLIVDLSNTPNVTYLK